MPTLTDSKQAALENDIQYQIDQITIHGVTERALLKAKDDTRRQLDLSVDANAGNGSGGGSNAGINSLVNGINQSNRVMLKLSIPIDDRSAKLGVASAKIALREAKIALEQTKWNKETFTINGWNSIHSAERALRFAESAEQLQFQTYEISLQNMLMA